MRLSEIDKDTFAGEVTGRVIGHHTTRLTFDLGPGVEIHGTGGGWQGTSVGLAAHQLCHYAQTGTPPEGRPELVAEYLQSYCEALYTRPGDSGTYDVPPLDHVQGEPTEPHEVVLVAAVARDLIAQGSPVSMVHLAVLAGVTHQYVRTLASRGELRSSGMGRGVRSVSADEARRWLGARGVPGCG